MNPALKSHPTRLFVELTTRCNLQCPMCVKQSAKGCLTDGDLEERHFSAMEEAMPHLEALLLNGIGEPLLHADLDRFISRARQLMPRQGRIGFQTNGFFIDEKRALSLLHAGTDRVCVSVDGTSIGTYRAVRGKGDPGVPGRALSALSRAARLEGNDQFRTGIEFVVLKENIGELPSVLKWGAAHGIRFAIVTQLLPYDESMADHIAYDTNTDAALSYYSSWKIRAEKEGIDISDYFDFFMKFRKSSGQERIAAFIRDMVSDAMKHGVSLHMKSLMTRDEGLLERTREAFGEARNIAREEGIDLILPETVPRSARRCDFIEEGSAFVSREGLVHPCHFLWHRFSCYLGGQVNHVKPQVFGDLGRSGILEIWNDGAFRAFRENVLRYDFPFCYDCNFALCDLIQDENFIHDCYLAAVPCAGCLWCTGLFHCMR